MIDGFLTMIRFFARTRYSDMTFLFKSKAGLGWKLETVLRDIMNFEKTVVMTPNPFVNIDEQKRQHDVNIKTMWCNFAGLVAILQPNGHFNFDAQGHVMSRVECFLNPVRTFTQYFLCNCPLSLGISRMMGNFRICTQKERSNFENALCNQLPDYAPSCT